VTVVPRRARPRSIKPQPVVEHAVDGTPLYAPLGELPTEVDGSAVQCHLCGRWLRQLGSSHVVHAHGVTAAEYRLLAGLRPRHPLQAPDLSVVRAARMRHRIATDPRLRRAMAAGVALARAGTLQRTAGDALRERPVAIERERQLVESSARLGTARAAAYREHREQRARALGYESLENFYRCRYVSERTRLDRLAADLGCAESAVRGDLRRLALGPDRSRSHGARWREQS
jgi:hypothetical protein